MKRYIIILLLLALTTFHLLGEENKSAVKAMLFSALVPGSGQAYLGSYTKAGIFISSEILLIGTALRLDSEVDWAIDTYQQYAYSMVDIPIGSDKEIYQNIQNYISSDEYNADMSHDAWRYFVLGYNDLQAYYTYVEANQITGDQSWDWGDDKTWKNYKSYRIDKQNLEMYSNLAVAAVVLNHLVGIIDTALTSKRMKKNSQRVGNLYINPDLEKKGIIVGYEYKF
ncbi:MAG: hypothetical protein RAO94_10535 [Candidatus Stygibacter australis]|nr:hypothetical protein [Candidatus Stygibacter australis]MDP8322774.1 hypothetical protein [Candidatus Stygibacter australis]